MVLRGAAYSTMASRLRPPSGLKALAGWTEPICFLVGQSRPMWPVLLHTQQGRIALSIGGWGHFSSLCVWQQLGHLRGSRGGASDRSRGLVPPPARSRSRPLCCPLPFLLTNARSSSRFMLSKPFSSSSSGCWERSWRCSSILCRGSRRCIMRLRAA